MRTIHYIAVSGLLLTQILSACSGQKQGQDTPEEGIRTALVATDNQVTVTTLKKVPFEHELVSNGKVTAGVMAELRFESTGTVARVYVKNGDRVSRGQRIAELDTYKLSNNLTQAKSAFEQAKLELQDVLIGQGYAIDKQNNVPADILKLARVKSGYDRSEQQYELARYELEHATLTAPIGGTIANLFTKAHSTVSPAETFCSVVGSTGMEASFSVLESELPLIKAGDEVEVTPYAGTGQQYKGHVTEINPIVDDNGMVQVKASVSGDSRLFSGMNVRVSVRRSLGPQLVVPKSAVVLRTGRQVVFTLENGRALWNYVQTAFENADSYTIVPDSRSGSGLKEGDVIIVTGNVNLAHETPVTVIATDSVK